MVYFIQVGESGPIKIGYTRTDPTKRLSELQTGNPYKLRLLLVLEGGFDLEHALHEKFADLRLEGEWFRNDPILLKSMASIAARQQKLNEIHNSALIQFVKDAGRKDTFG